MTTTRVIPTQVHAVLDYLTGGTLVAASPWLFGFVGNGRKYWLPHVIVGATEILAAATAKTR